MGVVKEVIWATLVDFAKDSSIAGLNNAGRVLIAMN